MGLSNWRKRFFEIRTKCQVIVKSHAFKDYPERGFSKPEIIDLIKYGVGRVQENKSPEAISESFLFLVKDEFERPCKLVVLLKEVEISDSSGGSGGTRKETIIVCSAYREVSHETPKN